MLLTLICRNRRESPSNIYKLTNHSWGWPKGFFFNSYYTQLFGRSILLSLDCSLYTWSILYNAECKARWHQVQFWYDLTGDWVRPLVNTLIIMPMGQYIYIYIYIYVCVCVCVCVCVLNRQFTFGVRFEDNTLLHTLSKDKFQRCFNQQKSHENKCAECQEGYFDEK